MLGTMQVDIIDPVASYARLMQRLFDFERIRALLRGRAFACASTPCTPSPAPMRMPSSSASSARQPAA